MKASEAAYLGVMPRTSQRSRANLTEKTVNLKICLCDLTVKSVNHVLAPREPCQGSHRIWYNPSTDLDTAVPDWGTKDLKPGTVRAIIRQLGISRKEFCSIK